VGDFLAIKWNDTEESVLPLESVRRACPCARCSGEPDVTGAVRRMGPAPTYTARSFEVVSLERVGTYAIALRWGDGHDTGIFTWSLLRQLGEVDGA
jgi:DUF971 family protein